MVQIMITGFYSPGQFKKNLAVYMSPDKPKYPDYIKKMLNVATGTGDFKLYAIYEVPNDKVYESIKYLQKRYAWYASELEGYEYDIEIVGPIEDAVDMLK